MRICQPKPIFNGIVRTVKYPITILIFSINYWSVFFVFLTNKLNAKLQNKNKSLFFCRAIFPCAYKLSQFSEITNEFNSVYERFLKDSQYQTDNFAVIVNNAINSHKVFELKVITYKTYNIFPNVSIWRKNFDFYFYIETLFHYVLF